MLGIRSKIVNNILRALWIAETFLNRGFVFVRARLRATRGGMAAPNDSVGWEKMYLSRVKPVTALRSEVARAVEMLTLKDESLLETGCGSGAISAELAIADRRAAVCDFSQPILDRVKRLFEASVLPEPKTYLVDLMKPLPFDNGQFDVVWNSGVLEHWTDDELRPIVAELARCAKRCVISLVPNERSLLYRYGRETAERRGISPWGREMPRTSLKRIFESAGLIDIVERTICLGDAPGLIAVIDPVFAEKMKSWWNSIPDDDPVKEHQGYLLLTVGYKPR